MGKIDYDSLYKLQDSVLQAVFCEQTEFYLTGGTCLNRFYFKARFSDDLDFFTNFSSTFYFAINAIKRVLKSFHVKVILETKDFVRLSVEQYNQILQIDFFNDRVKRFGEITNKNGVLLDNPLNILSNKLTTVLSRNEAKDVFDIYLICSNQNFNWSEILIQTREKMLFQKEDLLYKLKTFPYDLLHTINLKDTNILSNFDNKLSLLITDIENEVNNSLYK